MPSPSLTYTLTNSTTADADQVMQNFNDIINGLTDGTKDLSINALTVAGTATLNGSVNLGNAAADDLTFTGSLASSIPIKTDATYDIGSSSLGLRSIYLGGNSQRVRIMPSGSTSASWTLTLPTTAGTNKYLLKTDGSGNTSWSQIDDTGMFAAGAYATALVPGIISTTTQSFAGDKTFNGGVYIDNEAQLRLYEADANGSDYVAFKSPASLAASYTLTMPPDDGDANELLGTNGSGTLDWTKITSTNFFTTGAEVTQSAPGVVKSAGQLLGTNTNDDAGTGYVGELESESLAVGSANALSTGIAENLVGTTLGLSAGHWRISGSVAFVGASGTTVSQINVSLSTTTGTLAGNSVPDSSGQIWVQRQLNVTLGTNEECVVLPTYDVKLSGSTTLFIVVRAAFAVSTLSAYGRVQAVRVR
jgi:hypothetical protein